MNHSSSVFQESLLHFCHIFSHVQIEGRPECSASSTDICPFLKCLNHLKVCIWPGALSSNASGSILCVSTAILPSMKQNLMQIHCSFTPAGQYDCNTALPWRHKNAQKKHAHPHSRMLLGKLVHKGYSSWYLAAHNCTTCGVCAAVQYQGLLGSISDIPGA